MAQVGGLTGGVTKMRGTSSPGTALFLFFGDLGHWRHNPNLCSPHVLGVRTALMASAMRTTEREFVLPYEPFALSLDADIVSSPD